MCHLVEPLVCHLDELFVGLWMGPSMGPSMSPLVGPSMNPLAGPSMSPLAEPLAEPLMGKFYPRRPFHARAASIVLASIGAPLSWLGISAILPAAAAAVLGLPLHTSGPPLTLHIFPKLSAFLPKTTLNPMFSSSPFRKYRLRMELPALFRVPESSFNVALLGSTPRVREKSFVAKSIAGCCGVCEILLVRR